MINSGTVSRKRIPKVFCLLVAIAFVTTGVLCAKERYWRAQVAGLVQELVACDAQLMGNVAGISFDQGFSIPEIQTICDMSTEYRREAVAKILDVFPGRRSNLRDLYVSYSEAEDVFAGCVKCMLRAMANLSKEMDMDAIARKAEAYAALYGEEDGKERMIQEFKDLADVARNAGAVAKKAFDDVTKKETMLAEAVGRWGLEINWDWVFQSSEDMFNEFILQLKSI